MLERPTTNNVRRVIDELFQAGEEFGKMKTDIFWVRAMVELGLTGEQVLAVWDSKDQNSRNAREGTDT